MNIEKLKPVPKYILARIQKEDKKRYPSPVGNTRFYAYLTTIEKELCKVTVAVRNRYKDWHYKQVAVHGIHSDKCYVRDMEYSYLGGYLVGWYSEGCGTQPKPWEDGIWYPCDDKYYDPWSSCINLEYAETKPEYRYSALQLYGDYEVLKYLRLYEQFPQMEYLVKCGLKRYAMSKQILRKMGKEKAFIRFLLQNKPQLTKRIYDVDVVLRAYSTGRPLDELQEDKNLVSQLVHDSAYKDIKGEFKGKQLVKLARYIYEGKISTPSYRDYYQACKQLGLDLTENKHAFPHDFKHWHDVRIDEYATKKAEQDAIARKAFYEQFAGVAQKYLSLQHSGDPAFAIIIAKSPAELVQEGKALNHCVGRMNYDQKVVREEALIFFVRAKDQPEQPFVTVEYSLKKHQVLQCYGQGNSKPKQEVLDFVYTNWLPYANKAVQKIAA